MKRYRILSYDFDTRATLLSMPNKDHWEESTKEQWIKNKTIIKEGLIAEYGTVNAFKKIENFIDIGENPISVIAFHNKFLKQIISAYVVGSYYPALTSACALGERILNHLVIRLRENRNRVRLGILALIYIIDKYFLLLSSSYKLL